MMDLKPQTEDRFLEIFNEVKEEIRNQEGCMGLELLTNIQGGNTLLWTISIWQSVNDLETYRNSPLFRKTWSEVKPFFASKARAWTLDSIQHLP
jgi:heme-degrading monooxygenase HmoA